MPLIGRRSADCVGGVFVDLDGTLVDRTAVLRSWAADVVGCGGDPAVVDWLVEFDREGEAFRDRRAFLGGVAARLGLDASADELLEAWPTTFASRYRLDDAVRDALVRARERGFRIAVVSNGDMRRQRTKVEALGLEALVDACVISGEIGLRKPDPRIFSLAAERAGFTLSDATWAIGDDPVADIGGGRLVGAIGFWVNRSGAEWPIGLRHPEKTFQNPVEALDHLEHHRAGQVRGSADTLADRRRSR